MVEEAINRICYYSQTIYKFENGYGVSIIEFYSNENKRYEIAVLHYIDAELYELSYPDFTGNDVITCQDSTEIDAIIAKVQLL